MKKLITLFRGQFGSDANISFESFSVMSLLQKEAIDLPKNDLGLSSKIYRQSDQQRTSQSVVDISFRLILAKRNKKMCFI